MKKELIQYVMERANKCYSDDFPIHSIEEWINEFFNQYQPERSKREDYVCPECLNNYSEEDCKLRCGALNSMET